MNYLARACIGIAGVAALAGCAPADPPESPAAPPPAGPIAGTVNGEAVPKGALDVYLTNQFRKDPAELTSEELDRGRTGFVQMMALAQQARETGLDEEPEQQGQLFLQRISVLARAQLENTRAANPIDDAQLQAAYEAQLNSGSAREYKARHILVETEETARGVIEKLDSGTNFEELAEAESMDSSRSSGGDLGWFGEGRMVQPFWEATVALETGEYTTEPVQTQFGWHVILLEQTRDRPFSEAAKALRAGLERSRIENYVRSLEESAQTNWTSGSEAKNAENP